MVRQESGIALLRVVLSVAMALFVVSTAVQAAPTGASFSADPYAKQNGAIFGLTVTAAPPGSGTVTLDPSGGSYGEGTEVTLTAVAASGWVFDHWEGSLSGTDNPALIIMDGDKTPIRRIVAIDESEDGLIFTVRGDNLPDTEEVTEEDLAGVIVLNVPEVGDVVIWWRE